jgi:hypothetical protein
MFKSLIDLGTDVVKAVAAPIEVAVDLTRVVTKPVADAAESIRDEVEETTKDITEG